MPDQIALADLLNQALANEKEAVDALTERLGGDVGGVEFDAEAAEIARVLFHVREPSRSSDGLQQGLLRLLAHFEEGDAAFWRTQKANACYRPIVPHTYAELSALEPMPSRRGATAHASEPFKRLLPCWDVARSSR